MKWLGLLAALAAAVAAGSSSAQQLKEHATLGEHSQRVECLAFSADGKLLATGSGGYQQKPPRAWGELKLWDVATGKRIAAWEGHEGGIQALAFSPDGKTLATASSSNVIVWDRRTGRQQLTLKIPENSLRPCLGFSADGQMVGAVGYEAKRWDTATGKERSSFKCSHMDRSGQPAFSPDLKTLALPNYQDVDLWDTATGALRLSLEDHRGAVTQICFTEAGKTVVAACYRVLDDWTYRSEVRWWDVAAGKPLRTLRPSLDYLRGLSPNPNGKLLALTGAKRHDRLPDLVLIDLATERELTRVPLKALFAQPLFSPDGRILAVTADKEIKLWTVVPAGNR